MLLLSPSQNLESIIDGLAIHRAAEEVILQHQAFNLLIDQLGAVRRQMLAVEREAAALRLVEAGRIGRLVVEDEASAQLNSLVRDPGGKVVRPDFGGRSK
ncbi:hypothetical protein [Ensifer soli]|uniref:hypothetical protein n=1 Tax=Ciceribacter sp. sgz301302 TaxID=3342379 RepID=UPI0035B6AF4B